MAIKFILVALWIFLAIADAGLVKISLDRLSMEERKNETGNWNRLTEARAVLAVSIALLAASVLGVIYYAQAAIGVM